MCVCVHVHVLEIHGFHPTQLNIQGHGTKLSFMQPFTIYKVMQLKKDASYTLKMKHEEVGLLRALYKMNKLATMTCPVS